MAALEEKKSDNVKTGQDYIKEMGVKGIGEYRTKYHDIDDKTKALTTCFWGGEGHAVYRVSAKHKSNESIIVRKVSVTTTDNKRNKIPNQWVWSKYSELYPLMKKTKLLNYYDLYLTTENNIDYLLITMEELQMTLKEYVKSKYENDGPGISENECKQIIANIMSQLSTLHDEGYVHCDIKPDNIMLRDKKVNPEQNGWKLIDYDSMRFLVDGLHKTRLTLGARCWTAPEMSPFVKHGDVENYNELTYGVDMWGIGLIILYILNGYHLYDLTYWERWKCKYIPWAKEPEKVFYDTKLLRM